MKKQVRSLGVLLNMPLSLDAQVASMTGRLEPALAGVQAATVLGSVLMMVVHAPVTSWLNYCNDI